MKYSKQYNENQLGQGLLPIMGSTANIEVGLGKQMQEKGQGNENSKTPFQSPQDIDKDHVFYSRHTNSLVKPSYLQ